MQESYAEAIRAASACVAAALKNECLGMEETVREIDAVVGGMAREIGRQALSRYWNASARRVTESACDEGLRVERRPSVQFWSVFGPVQVESPYLRDEATGRSARPVKDRLGITHQGRTRALERALTDFGAEESFGHAAERFAEHYGFSVHRTTVMRVTEEQATAAEAFVHARLASDGVAMTEPLSTRPGADQLLVELDGCEIRTRRLEPAQPTQTTPVRGLPRRHAVQEWREVRVGLARQIDGLQPTYVAAMASYPDIVSSLVNAACAHGLSARTEVIAVADGGNGLKEELEVQFPRLTFVLDRPHVKGHLYETADAMGLEDDARHNWVRHRMERIDAGRVRDVIAQLRRHQGQGAE